MMNIYNINKKLAQEKLNSDKPIKWIAIYNNSNLEIRAGYVLYHKYLCEKGDSLPIGGGILKVESQFDATWKLSLEGKSEDFGACDLNSFKNENISAGSSLLVKNVSSTEMPDFIRAVLASCAAFIKRQPIVFTPDFARVLSISVSLTPGARMIRSFMVVSFQNH